MNSAIIVIAAAALLALSGAAFGVVMARFLWADDLRTAQEISLQDRIAIEAANRTIKARDETIRIKDEMIHALGQLKPYQD